MCRRELGILRDCLTQGGDGRIVVLTILIVDANLAANVRVVAERPLRRAPRRGSGGSGRGVRAEHTVGDRAAGHDDADA